MAKRLCLILALLVLAPMESFAACIGGHPSLQRESHNVTAIAIVSVVRDTSLQEDPDDPQGITAYLYTTNVVKVLHGKLPKDISIRTENTSSRLLLTVGTQYLLFLHQGTNGEFWVDSCGNSGSLPEKSSLAEGLNRTRAKTSHEKTE